MKRTDVHNESVILTEGMEDATGRRIYGLFASEEDARAEDADDRALGTLGAEHLTPEQRAIAADNTAELND